MMNYNLFLVIKSMKKQHHFCFLFTRIQHLNEQRDSLDFFANFKIYLLHNSSIIGQTNQILGIFNGNNEIIFRKEEIRCNLTQQNIRISSNLELKLTQILPSNEERLIGSYQFGINNYIHISDRLNRHCVELSIQIGQNHAIYYELFIDRIKQGVDQIIQEHQLSKKLIKQEDQDEMLPEQIQNFPQRTKKKEIKLSSDDFIVVNQRYWSPTWLQMHNTPKKQTKKRKLTKKNSINESSFSKIQQDNIQNFLHGLKMAESTIHDLDQLERVAQSQAGDNQISFFQLQIDQSNNSQIQEKTILEMYQVIRSNSKITLPKENDVFPVHNSSYEQLKKPIIRRSRKIINIKSLKKSITIFVLGVLLTMLILVWFIQPKSKKRTQQKKYTRQYSV